MPVSTIHEIDVEQFARDGFAVVHSVLSPDEVNTLQGEAERLIEVYSAPDPPTDVDVNLQWDRDFIEEDDADQQRTLRMIEPVVGVSPAFRALAYDPRIAGPAAAVLRDDVVHLFEDKLNCKLPGGSGFPWHQDWSCCWRGNTEDLVTCFVALDPADERNGTLQVIPGSHQPRRCLPFQTDDRFEVDAAHIDRDHVVLVEMAPGDMLLFDCYLLHHSERNRSDRARRTIIYTYGPGRVGPIYRAPEADDAYRRMQLGEDWRAGSAGWREV